MINMRRKFDNLFCQNSERKKQQNDSERIETGQNVSETVPPTLEQRIEYLEGFSDFLKSDVIDISLFNEFKKKYQQQQAQQQQEDQRNQRNQREDQQGGQQEQQDDEQEVNQPDQDNEICVNP